MRKGKKAKRMPLHLPGDHEHVTALLNESERMSAKAQSWHDAPVGNYKAYVLAMEQGWALALAAAYLRCYIKGELKCSPNYKGEGS